MGVNIIALSRASEVACGGGDECAESHFAVGQHRKRRDGMKSGCYVVGRGGRAIGFEAGTYGSFDAWRRQLSLGALGVEPEDVWENPRRFRRKPFVDLIDFPDGAGSIIGPETSAKLRDDFAAYAATAKKHFFAPPPTVASPREKKRRKHVNRLGLLNAERLARSIGGTVVVDDDPALRWQLYIAFRRAFKLASNDGFVLFC